jgi:phosphoserine phosphatase
MAETTSRALVLDAGNVGPGLDDRAVHAALDALAGHHVFDEQWLAPGHAYAMLFAADEDEPMPALRARIARAVAAVEPEVDCNIVSDDIVLRRKKLLVADMESTIIEQEMLDELADFIGARDKIAAITERAMRGELDFEAALEERVAMLAGLDATVLDDVAGRITLMPGARELVATMRAHGGYCALVSGGFTVFTARVARLVGFNEHQANVLEIENGKLTGRVVKPILGRQAKLAALRRLTAAHGLSPAQTIAVGDGANDLDMLAAAGLGVAFRAKPKVREAALAMDNGAVVSAGDLTGLLFLQGYGNREFAHV